MKTKMAVVILAVVCAGLAVALIAVKKTAHDQLNGTETTLLDISNQLVAANIQVNDLQQVNLVLTNNSIASERRIAALTNSLSEASGALASAKATLLNAQDQIVNLNGRITDLETQNRMLDDRATALTNSIGVLNGQIADAEQKLADSETNNVFLEKELQLQIAQRAELEHKFDDLNAVRTQARKLRGDIFVSRRLQAGGPADNVKGAQLLLQTRPANVTVARAPARTSHYDLNVEVGSDGSVHVIPPLTGATNAPAR